MTVRIIVKGLVQGVFYRASAKKEADRLRVKGIVKNLANNDVEIIATADESSIRAFAEWCKVGPPAAEVDEVIVQQIEDAVFSDFRIVR